MGKRQEILIFSSLRTQLCYKSDEKIKLWIMNGIYTCIRVQIFKKMNEWTLACILVILLLNDKILKLLL